jgi:hypothetical protein
MEKRNIVSYYDLSPEWQEEAVSNLDENAEENYYLEPIEDTTPTTHILWDLSEVMPHDIMYYEDTLFNASMAISNNSAMLLNIDDEFETAEILFV